MLLHQRQCLEQIALNFFKKVKEPLLQLMIALDDSDNTNIRDLADNVIFYHYDNKPLYKEMLRNFVLITITDFNDAKYELKKMLVDILRDEYIKVREDDN
jgi:hypothetical protein